MKRCRDDHTKIRQIYFKSKTVRDKEHYIMKGSIYHEDINLYVPNIGAPKYMTHRLP
jgi:hypothetical protein